jgi:hypothetical protein
LLDRRNEETIRGVRCRRYDAVADFDQARRTTSLLPLPVHVVHRDLSRLPVQIWVGDSSGLIREAVYWSEGRLQTRIQLSENGVPDPVEVPRDEHVVRDEA